MKTFLLAAAIAMMLPSIGHAADTTCMASAIDKNGKPLVGAAKNSFMSKCQADTKARCETAAIDKNGKPLAGAAKNSFTAKCVKDGVGA